MKNRNSDHQPFPRTLVALNRQQYWNLFSEDDRKRLKQLTGLDENKASEFTSWEAIEGLWCETEILITGWGTPAIPDAFFSQAQALRLVAHAGATQSLFQRLHLAPDVVKLALASSALGRSVAEFTFSLINLAAKRAFWMEQRVRNGGWRNPQEFFGGCFELYRAKVGLIGGGETARQLIRMLRPLECDLIVFDPYISPSLLQAEGARVLSSLEQLFEESDVISLHAAHTAQTEGMLRGEHFARLRDGGVFVNTARGAIIREDELIAELRKQRFVACLDVTCVEPPAVDHPFRTLPNVILTPHIAGAIAQNRFRMGRMAVDAVEDYMKQTQSGLVSNAAEILCE